MGTEDRITAAVTGRSRLRASDSDRERVLDMLKAAFVQGRLTRDELDVRVGQTLAARTWGDLTALTDDIPAWPLPRPVRKPARPPSSPSVPAFVKAVACAIIALGAIAIAGMPGVWTMQPPPQSMTAQACRDFADWNNPNYRSTAMLSEAVYYARYGSDPSLAGHLAALQRAYLRSGGVGGLKQSAAAQRQFMADAAQVTSDCSPYGY